MRANKNPASFLYIKDNYLNWMPESEQTNRMRSKINKKIRLLGDKYYKTKALFERLNFNRDILFLLGKFLEEKYHDTKQGIHLQVQTKRAKEALYCWYAEHFYDELFNDNSDFWKTIIPNFTTSILLDYQKKLCLQLQQKIEKNLVHFELNTSNFMTQNTIDNSNTQSNQPISQLNKHINTSDKKDESFGNDDLFVDFDNNLIEFNNIDLNDIKFY